MRRRWRDQRSECSEKYSDSVSGGVGLRGGESGGGGAVGSRLLRVQDGIELRARSGELRLDALAHLYREAFVLQTRLQRAHEHLSSRAHRPH